MRQENSVNGRNVYIRTVRGCVRRNLDAAKIGTYFLNNNFTIVDEPKQADYIIFFSCGVTNIMTEHCIKDIKKFLRYNAELIVSGCIPETAPHRLQKVFNGKTFSPKKLDKIDTIFPDNTIKLRDIPDQHSKWLNISHTEGIGLHIEFIKKFLNKMPIVKYFYKLLRKYILDHFFSETVLRFTPRNRGYVISISQGCIHRCSYCGIWKGVGPLLSKPVQQCVDEFTQGLSLGNTQFVISADDIGPYGIDIGSNLPELLDAFTSIDRDFQLTIAGTHPAWIIKYIDELIPIFERHKIKSLLFCIQSGNDRVLKLMRRSYNREGLISAVNRLRQADPQLLIDVQCIVGFPSETWEEFEDTLSLIEKARFSSGHMFSYIPVDNTDATKITPQHSKREIRKRSRYAVKTLREYNFSAVYDRSFKCLSFEDKNVYQKTPFIQCDFVEEKQVEPHLITSSRQCSVMTH